MVGMDRRAGSVLAVLVALLALVGGPVFHIPATVTTSADAVELTSAPTVRVIGARVTPPRLPSRPVLPGVFAALLAGALLVAPLLALRRAARHARVHSQVAPRLSLGRAPPLRVA
jgi:hypothetical protein